ncbi:uncharacterized protein LOC107040870 [Diachasma alloeum]|uniref:uncharacterized protein LOC107040870 n=1 Tax=Diachasma alloeum TaxID=454923 RepID=UPI0007383693|nr:uncharacterized protein LOC107040870 [Diachasma alloeum]
MSRTYGSFLSYEDGDHEDEDGNASGKQGSREKATRGSGPSAGKRTLKYRNPGHPVEVQRRIRHHNKERRELETSQAEDDALESSHKPKKVRRETRQVVTTDDPQKKKKTGKTYLIITISDDEDINSNSVKRESQSPNFQQNRGKDKRVSDEVMDEIMEQSIPYPSSRSVAEEVDPLRSGNGSDSSESGHNVKNARVLDQVMDEVMEQSIPYPSRGSNNREIDPLRLENESQSSESGQSIQNTRVLDQVMDEVFDQPIPYVSRTSINREIDPLRQEIDPLRLENESQSAESRQNRKNVSVLDQVMDEAMRQSTPYSSKTSINQEIDPLRQEIDPLRLENESQSPESEDIGNDTTMNRLITEVMDHSIHHPLRTLDYRGINPHLLKNESQFQYDMNQFSDMDQSYSSHNESSISSDQKETPPNFLSVDPQFQEIDRKTLRGERRMDQIMNEVMNQSIHHPLRTPDHQQINPPLPKDQSQSQGSEQNIKSDAMFNRLETNDMNQSPDMDQSYSSLCESSISSDQKETFPNFLSVDPQSQEIDRSTLGGERRLDQIMNEVMNQSIYHPLRTPDHQQINPPLPKDQPQSQDSEQNIKNDAMFNRLETNDMNQSPDMDQSYSSLCESSISSDQKETLLDVLNVDPQSQEIDRSTLGGERRMDQIMNEVMNQSSIKEERMTPGDSQEQIDDQSFNLAGIKVKRQSPHREYVRIGDHEDLEAIASQSTRDRYQAKSESQSSSCRDTLIIDDPLNSEFSPVSSDYSKFSPSRRSRHRVTSDTQSSSYLHRLIDHALDSGLSSVPSDGSESVSIDRNVRDLGRERTLDSDDEDDDEFTPQARPRDILQANVDDSLVISNRENNKSMNDRRRNPGDDYYFRKHFGPDENKAMIDVLIQDNQIDRATKLTYWMDIAQLQLPGLKGRSGKSLHNRFMRFLLSKRYAAYTGNPLALAQFEALYEEWFKGSRPQVYEVVKDDK